MLIGLSFSLSSRMRASDAARPAPGPAGRPRRRAAAGCRSPPGRRGRLRARRPRRGRRRGGRALDGLRLGRAALGEVVVREDLRRRPSSPRLLRALLLARGPRCRRAPGGRPERASARRAARERPDRASGHGFPPRRRELSGAVRDLPSRPARWAPVCAYARYAAAAASAGRPDRSRTAAHLALQQRRVSGDLEALLQHGERLVLAALLHEALGEQRPRGGAAGACRRTSR